MSCRRVDACSEGEIADELCVERRGVEARGNRAAEGSPEPFANVEKDTSQYTEEQRYDDEDYMRDTTDQEKRSGRIISSEYPHKEERRDRQICNSLSLTIGLALDCTARRGVCL